MQALKKIVVIGPESTGKSTLCEELAGHYNTLWCREYAREYLHKYGKDYTYNDLLTIAKGQIEREDREATRVTEQNQSQTLIRTPILFVDTDMYVMKVWCEFVYNQCHPWIIDQIVSRRYDLYLLCNTDLPWEKDALREYPDVATREKLFRMYKDLMINQATPWVIISGNHECRIKQALAAIAQHLSIS